MDPAALKARLHDAIERVVDSLVVEELNDEDVLTALVAIGSSEESGSAARLVTVEPASSETDSFVYRLPSGDLEEYNGANAYRVGDGHRVIVGRTHRQAWGEMRGRAVVFHAASKDHPPERWYPWTEFVETDDGDYAATIPNPTRPRAVLTERDDLPRQFVDQRVERADALFGSIREGASLRLVVEDDDEEAMIRHGYWVAELRKRF